MLLLDQEQELSLTNVASSHGYSLCYHENSERHQFNYTQPLEIYW